MLSWHPSPPSLLQILHPTGGSRMAGVTQATSLATRPQLLPWGSSSAWPSSLGVPGLRSCTSSLSAPLSWCCHQSHRAKYCPHSDLSQTPVSGQAPPCESQTPGHLPRESVGLFNLVADTEHPSFPIPTCSPYGHKPWSHPLSLPVPGNPHATFQKILYADPWEYFQALTPSHLLHCHHLPSSCCHLLSG